MLDREAEQILRRRTSKLIGGYVTEHLFYKTFLERSGLRWTKGWWGAIEANDSRRLHFFVVKEQLNEVDILFIKQITSAGYDWGQIWGGDGHWMIYADGETRTTEQYAFDHMLQQPNNGHVRNNNNQDPLIDKCIDYYRNNGLLLEIAQSILLEDAFLNRYFITINLDFIYATLEGQPVVLEVKFKDEFSKKDSEGFRRLVFGMDQKPYDNYFKKIIEAGICVYNVILYNDLKSGHNVDTTDIFNYLKNKGAGERLWKIKRLPPTMDNYVVHHTYNTNTSFKGNTGRNHYCIPMNEYLPFPNVNETNTWGKCAICGEDMILVEHRKMKYEFKGCINYENHPQ